jgi:hypothetical protein
MGIADEDLDEGAGQLLRLPRRRRLAGAQPDDDVLHPERLARLHDEVAREAVALVQKADHRHAVLHRSRARGLGDDGLRDVDDRRLAPALPAGRPLLAGAQRGEARRDRRETAGASHALSGVQAS